MKKQKLLSLFLALTMTFALVSTAAAVEESVTPTPPEWISADYYLIFPGDEVYQPENWAKVLELRDDARNGGLLPSEKRDWAEGSAGMCYETALVRLRYSDNETDEAAIRKAYYSACRALLSAESTWLDQNGNIKDDLYNQIKLWTYRSGIYYREFNSNFVNLIDGLGITLDDFFNAPYASRASAEVRAKIAQSVSDYRNRIIIRIDGWSVPEVSFGTKPVSKNGRIMIPIRAVAERLGADVEWVQEAQQIVMTRAGVTVVMTIGQSTATVDGVPMEMDIAPYAVDGRTLLPVRYVAEFFGQKVTWDEESRYVNIEEDKTVVGDSNLEAWALPMDATMDGVAHVLATRFGQQRGRDTVRSSDSVVIPTSQSIRTTLSSGWGVNDRNSLIEAIFSTTYHGHNEAFLTDVAYIKGLTSAQYNQHLNSTGMDSYMFSQTKTLDEKWGDKGILCWDLFRVSSLIQWGYTAGYLTYAEALALLEPAATLLKEKFSSWNEACENYLDGYNWWARNDMTGKDLWTAYRGGICKDVMENNAALFDDAIFTREIVSVPGITAQQILDGITSE